MECQETAFFMVLRREDLRAKGFMQGIATGVALRGSGYLERVVIKEYILS